MERCVAIPGCGKTTAIDASGNMRLPDLNALFNVASPGSSTAATTVARTSDVLFSRVVRPRLAEVVKRSGALTSDLDIDTTWRRTHSAALLTIMPSRSEVGAPTRWIESSVV